jgi:hypothetical protein
MASDAFEVTTEVDGKTYSGRGRGSQDGKTVTVNSAFGSKTSHIGGLTASDVARLMLGELVREHLRKG